jgi:hypothetical protein
MKAKVAGLAFDVFGAMGEGAKELLDRLCLLSLETRLVSPATFSKDLHDSIAIAIGKRVGALIREGRAKLLRQAKTLQISKSRLSTQTANPLKPSSTATDANIAPTSPSSSLPVGPDTTVPLPIHLTPQLPPDPISTSSNILTTPNTSCTVPDRGKESIEEEPAEDSEESITEEFSEAGEGSLDEPAPGVLERGISLLRGLIVMG